MLRRLRVTLFRRSLLFLLLICFGCSAQSAPPELSRRIERHVRAYYSLPADVQVLVAPLQPSEFTGYDAVVVTISNGAKNQNYDFLVSKDGKTLARMTKLDLSTDPYAEVMKKLSWQGRPTRGNKDAKVVAVNFDDFQCPYCSRLHQTLFPQILSEYGDRVLFVYKDYPLDEIHPWATRAAINANCLAGQSNDAYWSFADAIHANQHEVNAEKGRDAQLAKVDQTTLLEAQKRNLDLAKLQSCIKAQDNAQVKASIREGDALGVNATPAMFVNGFKVDGALPFEELRSILDRALVDAGVQPPKHPASPATAAPAAR
jgi:protein-disulfide isomerase